MTAAKDGRQCELTFKMAALLPAVQNSSCLLLDAESPPSTSKGASHTRVCTSSVQQNNNIITLYAQIFEVHNFCRLPFQTFHGHNFCRSRNSVIDMPIFKYTVFKNFRSLILQNCENYASRKFGHIWYLQSATHVLLVAHCRVWHIGNLEGSVQKRHRLQLKESWHYSHQFSPRMGHKPGEGEGESKEGRKREREIQGGREGGSNYSTSQKCTPCTN